MKRKFVKQYQILCLALFAVLAFSACNDDDNNGGNNIIDPVTFAHSVYVAAAGNYGQNDGTVGVIDYVNNAYAYTDLYKLANNRGIGDAQDVLPIGNVVYVACTTSSKIEILDGKGASMKTISRPEAGFRYLATDGTYIYASAYNGYIYKLHGQDLVDSTKVGGWPEAMSVAGGKLYVNMSDHNYDNSGSSISVVDLSTFKKTKELTCILNPYSQSQSDGKYVYFVSAYHADRDGAVQRINSSNDQIDSLCEASIISYDKKNNSLVCLTTQYDANWIPAPKSFFRLNLKTLEKTDIQTANVKAPAQINVNPVDGNIYVVSNPSYTEPSSLYILNSTGNLLAGPITMGTSVQNIRFNYYLK